MPHSCRFRIFEVSDHGETIRVYKRTEHDKNSEHDEILDEMVLVGDGSLERDMGRDLTVVPL